MPKYMVVKNADGDIEAHGSTYGLKDGEKEVGEVEANSVEQATKKAKKQFGPDADGADGSDDDEDADSGPRSLLQSREPSPEEKEKENARLREEEEAKEEFTVMVDPQTGAYYVEGDEATDPAKKKAAAKKPEPKEEEPAEVGTFRAKDAAEAIKMAKGEQPNPAEGPARGAQTP